MSLQGRAQIVLGPAATYGPAGNNEGRALSTTADGGVVALGYSDGFARNADFYLVRTSASGEKLWERAIGGAFDDVGCAIAPTRDGGFILAGTSESFVDGHNGRDIMLVKVDANGELRE